MKIMKMEPALKKAFLYPTMLCNLNCKMCYSGAKRDQAVTENEMSFLDYQNLIAGLYERGVRNFDISGGEPFLRTDLVSILKEIKKFNGTTTYMVSNGTLIQQHQEAVKAAMPFIDRLYISMDSTVAEIHNEIRGNPEAFVKALAGISELSQMGFQNIGINFLIMDDNKDEILSMLNFAAAQNLKFMNLLRLLDVSKNSSVCNQHLNLNLFTDIYDSVQAWVDEQNHQAEPSRLSEVKLVLPAYCLRPLMGRRKKSCDTDSDRLKLLVEYDPLQGCMAFSDSIIIKSDGAVTGCTAMANCSEFFVGNIRDQEYIFFENWKKNKQNLFLREKNLKNEEPCKSCEHWKICRGGCPAVAYKYYGDFFRADPTCIKTANPDGSAC